MPRYYERKSTRGDWSTDSMEQALLAFDDGQPLLDGVKMSAFRAIRCVDIGSRK